jgi:purine-binding chemotaxis protein CheW
MDRAVAKTDSASAPWLICRAGGACCALPLDRVSEIFRPLPIEPVADAPRAVLGLAIIRGVPLPVVDLGLLIADCACRPERMVALDTGSRRLALVADEVIGIRVFDASAFEALPPLLQDAANERVAAIGTHDAELLLVLRTARLLPDDAPLS